ncbi:MAG: hypothetical protein DMF53_12820 [Acidobacteria bacterium]|nr:MAG: hypothetical protein DMF53_12820 [Acidobacteriota bacterium]
MGFKSLDLAVKLSENDPKEGKNPPGCDTGTKHDGTCSCGGCSDTGDRGDGDGDGSQKAFSISLALLRQQLQETLARAAS